MGFSTTLSHHSLPVGDEMPEIWFYDCGAVRMSYNLLTGGHSSSIFNIRDEDAMDIIKNCGGLLYEGVAFPNTDVKMVIEFKIRIKYEELVKLIELIELRPSAPSARNNDE